MKKYIVLLSSLLLVTVIFFYWSPGIIRAQENPVIEIPERVEVSSSTVLLGDIAEIEGVTENKLKELEAIEIFKFNGKFTEEISRSQMAFGLRQQEEIDSKFKLRMSAEGTTLELESAELGSNDIQNRVTEYLAENLELDSDKIESEVIIGSDDIRYPDGAEIKLGNIDFDKIPGTINPQLQIYFEDQVWKRVYLAFDVSITRQVYSAREDISPGENLVEDDFIKQSQKIESRYKGELITDWDSEITEEDTARGRIREKDILTTEMISSDQSLYRSGYNSDSEESSTDNEEKKDKEENEIIVRWGDKLKASISIGNINISTTVEARETGAKNEVIEVKNKESEKILEARIINSEEVEIQ